MLQGKVVIVTGGASGMGRAAATLCAARGASVVVADRDEQGARAVAEQINAAGGVALAHSVDLTSEPAVQEMVDATLEAFGTITALHKRGVRCNTIVPGWTIGTGWAKRPDGPDLSEAERALFERALVDVCMPRLALPEDVAPVVAFLASDDARYVQAATIDVNGGLLAHMGGAAGQPTPA